MRFGHQAKRSAVAIETPGATVLHDFDARLVVTIKELVRDLAGWGFVREFEGVGAEPPDIDDSDQRIREDPSDGGVRLELLKLAHAVATLGKVYATSG